MSNPLFYPLPSSPLLSHIPSILPRPPLKGQECFQSAFSCRVAYYILLLGTSNTHACKGANSLYQSPCSYTLQPSFYSFHLLLFPPECLARQHAVVSQHPALNEKGHLNSLETEGSEGQLVCLPHSCRSSTGQGSWSRENNLLFDAFFMEQFSPLLPLVPVDITFC